MNRLTTSFFVSGKEILQKRLVHSNIISFLIKVLSILFILFLITINSCYAAESYSLEGWVSDEQGVPIEAAHVLLFTSADTLLFRGSVTSKEGRFHLRQIPAGNYHLAVRFLGYQTEEIEILVTESNITDLHIRIRKDMLQLDGLEIIARPDPVTVSGDTTIFNAAAFPVHSEAMAEDLIRRMPGFTIENGTIHAQGEQVQQILVDGEEFFGSDPNLAMRNLPAEIIRQIQVFDQASDQAEFTGFDDGETIRTVNIITRRGVRDGQFGQANIQMGTQERWLGGANVNKFRGTRRISILGLSNNINQLNFSSESLAGVAQAGQASSRGGRGGGGDRSGRGGGSGDWGMADNTAHFLLGDQQGINTVHSFGVNYIDRWQESWRVSSSYFFNHTRNSNDRILDRQFLDEISDGNFYQETSLFDSDQFNHRFNARMEYTIDPLRSILIRPRLNIRHGNTIQNLVGQSFISDNPLASPASAYQSTYEYDSKSFQYDIHNSILYRRRFNTQGRTLSTHIFIRAERQTADRFQIGESRISEANTLTSKHATYPASYRSFLSDIFGTDFNPLVFYGVSEAHNPEEDLFLDNLPEIRMEDQKTEILTRNESAGTNIQYTEPLTSRSQLMIGYRPVVEYSQSERNLFHAEKMEGQKYYTIPDEALTSEYANLEVSHRPGVGFRLRGEGFHFNTSLTWEYTSVNGEQAFPYEATTRRSFSSLLPRVMVMKRFSDGQSLRLMYHTRLRTPSVVQLQDVIDNTDPLILTGGNPDLKEQYIHRLTGRYRKVNSSKETSLLGFFNIQYTADYIGNRIFSSTEDTLLTGDVLMVRGARLIIPDHTGNAWDIRSFVNYSFPFSLIKSNINLNTGVRYLELPTLFNDQRNHARQTTLNTGMIINSTGRQEVDISLSYQAGYHFVRNTLHRELNDDYYTGRASFRFHLLPRPWLAISSEANIRHYYGLSEAYNRNIFYWNASVGYRFLSNRSAQLRITITDIIGQNKSIHRIVTDMYIDDMQSEVLTRYVMAGFIYHFRSFTESQR